MSHVIYFLGEELSNFEHAMQQRAPHYRPGLSLDNIEPEEFSQIFDTITKGANLPLCLHGFLPKKFNFGDLRSRSNIDEIKRVMQQEFLPVEYTAEQVANAFTYFAQSAGPACIAGDLIKAVLSKQFSLGFGGQPEPVYLVPDLKTRKFTSIKLLSYSQYAHERESATLTHVTIQSDKRIYAGHQTLGFSQLYAVQYPSIAIFGSRELFKCSFYDMAFVMVVKVFMPLAVGAVPRLEEVLITIKDFDNPLLKIRIESIKDTLHLAIFEPSMPDSNVKWTFPAAVGVTTVPVSALSALRWNNNCDISLKYLTSEQIDQAYGALANDIRKLDAQKLLNIGPTRLSINNSPYQYRRHKYGDVKHASDTSEIRENRILQGHLLTILRNRAFYYYEDLQLLNLCIAIGETKFNYLKTMVRKIKELFANQGCRLEKYDEIRPLYTIAPREDCNTFDYCYKCNWTEIILGSRKINRETYGWLLDRPLLTISIKTVYPAITGQLIQVTAISFTSYVFELDDCIPNVVDLIQKGELNKMCLDEFAVYNDPRQAIQRAEQEADMAAAASAGDRRSNADWTVGSPTRRARTGGLSSPVPTHLTLEPFPSPFPWAASPSEVSSPDMTFDALTFSSPPVGEAQAPVSPSQTRRKSPRRGLPFDSQDPNS